MSAVCEVPEQLLILMKNGFYNEYCSIKIGESVVKGLTEEGDLNKEGTKGKVVGNIYHPHLGEGYMVIFEGLGGLEIFIAGGKLKKL